MNCYNLKKVEIPPDSNLQTIEKYSFCDSDIEEIFIPSKVSEICESALASCRNLIKVEYAPNSNLQTIESSSTNLSRTKQVSADSKMKSTNELLLTFFVTFIKNFVNR